MLPSTVMARMAQPPRPRALPFLTATLSLLAAFAACSSSGARSHLPARAAGSAAATAPATRPVAPAPAAQPATIFPVMLGIDVLEHEGYAAVKGKRIGLLTHAAGVDRRGVSTVDVLRRAPGVRLVALFAPEHGLYGVEEAGRNFADTIDRRTGLPVYSLYGRTRKPTRQMLRGLDALVIDLQDIGVRSYTYASSLRYAMEACFENNVEVIVLDRPNPLGGLKVDGPPMDPDLVSYVGAFRVPYVHGLTIGELARIAASVPGMLAVPEAVRLKGRLTIVSMRGWRRSMRWPDTGLPFIPTSPYVQDFSSVVGYAMTGLGCEIGGFTWGVGRSYPFRGISYKGRTAEQLEQALRALHLPGLNSMRVAAPAAAGNAVTGVYIEVTDWDDWRPAELSFHLMRLACQWNATNPFAAAPPDKVSMFRKLVGSNAWWNAIRRDGARVDVAGFLADWRSRDLVYQQQTRRYWLYPE